MYAALLTAFLFALTGICATQASKLLGAGRANAWRLIVALVIFALWILLTGSTLGGGVLRWFLLAGALGFGLGGWCMFQALRRIGSTLSLLIVECAAAVFATTIGWTWLGATLGTTEILLAALILTGVVIGMSPGPIPSLARRQVLAGGALALTAALFQAVSFNLSRHAFNLLEEAGTTLSFASAACQRLIGGALVALLLAGITRLVRRRNRAAPPAPYRSSLPAPIWVFLNALFGPVLGVTAMLWAISLVRNPGLVQAVAATATLMTIPLACHLERARPGITYYTGCLIALAGTTGLLLLHVE